MSNSFFEVFSQTYLNSSEGLILLLLMVVSLMVLYAISAIHHKLRILDSEVSSLRAELRLHTEELESLAQILGSQEESSEVSVSI